MGIQAVAPIGLNITFASRLSIAIEADVNPGILFYATSSCCKQLDSNNHLHQDYSGRRAQPAQGNVCKVPVSDPRCVEAEQGKCAELVARAPERLHFPLVGGVALLLHFLPARCNFFTIVMLQVAN
ncbi:unnamed protein product [Urochloa humidicola]